MLKPDNTVIVTGCGGFLGKYMTRECRAAGHRVVGLSRGPEMNPDCDVEIKVADIAMVDWGDIFLKYRPKVVYHLAATASVQASIADPISDFNNVLPATARMMFSAAKHCPDVHVIYFSSAAVYGNPVQLPISESAPVAPISPYGINKSVAEQLLDSFTSCYGVKSSVLRVFSAYGAGLKRQIFFDIAQKAKSAVSANESAFVLFGTGEETRDFIHAADVARFAGLIGENSVAGQKFEIYNIASGRQLSVRQAAEEFIRAAGLNVRVDFNGIIREGDPRFWSADVSKAARLGCIQKIGISEGLKGYADWLSAENII